MDVNADVDVSLRMATWLGGDHGGVRRWSLSALGTLELRWFVVLEADVDEDRSAVRSSYWQRGC